MHRLPILLALICLLFLTACTANDGFDAGRPITPEELESLADAFQKDDASAPSISITDTVFWTEGGSVCHRDENCRYLKNAKEIKRGTYGVAAKEGKDALCSACGGQ